MACSMPGCPVPQHRQSLPRFMSIELVMPSYHLILCCPHLLLFAIFPRIRVFSNESALRIRWPKFWNFSFSISLSNENSKLISFRIDWFDLFAVQETGKSLPQHHSLKAVILQLSAFFMVQVSHPHMTTRKIWSLTSISSILTISININLINALLPWWFSGKESACQCRRHGFDLLVGKIPWRRKWGFLPGKSHGQRSSVG